MTTYTVTTDLLSTTIEADTLDDAIAEFGRRERLCVETADDLTEAVRRAGGTLRISDESGMLVRVN